MPHKYFPHTQQDIAEMLARCGVTSIDDLFSEIPEPVRFRKEFHLPEEKSEMEIRQFFDELGKENRQLTCFAGAGVYDKYTPAVIPSLVKRISDELHALSGRSFAGNTALYFRIPNHDGRTYGHAGIQCINV